MATKLTTPAALKLTSLISSSLSGIGFGKTSATTLAANSPQLKPVEPAAVFQKVRNQLGEQTLDGENLRFTFCDSNDYSQRPFANLFTSFRLPSNSTERNTLKNQLVKTALAPLALVDKFIAVEIPRNAYGELVDGKSLELTIPQKSGSTFYSVNLHGSFFGFNPDLNTQVSDANAVSSLFSGVEPTAENDFNTNIAYMFSNEISRPKDTVYTQTVQTLTEVTHGPNDTQRITLQQPLQKDVPYGGLFMQIVNIIELFVTTAVGDMHYYDAIDINNSTASSMRFKYEVTGLKMVNNDAIAKRYSFEILQYITVSNNEWRPWSVTHRFPNAQGGEGKSYARFTDNSLSLLVDEPVGIAYLDKGFILITHPTLIQNFDLSEAFEVDQNGVLSPYSQNAEDSTTFTRICFPVTSNTGSNRARLKCRSVVTEYIQSYTCLAMPDEFFETTNPTYRQAYPAGTGNIGQQPLQITEIGLYNKFGEMVAVAKATKPLEKAKTSVAVFDISLKI